jgi:hypothetical protein
MGPQKAYQDKSPEWAVKVPMPSSLHCMLTTSTATNSSRQQQQL